MPACRLDLYVSSGSIRSQASISPEGTEDFKWAPHPSSGFLYLMSWPPQVTMDGAAWAYSVDLKEGTSLTWLRRLQKESWFGAKIRADNEPAIKNLKELVWSEIGLKERAEWLGIP